MKSGTTRLDKNRIFKHMNLGDTVSQMSGALGIKRDHVELVVKAFKSGSLMPPREMLEPKSRIAQADEVISSQHAEIDALKAQLEEAQKPAGLTSGQKAAATRKANKEAAEQENADSGASDIQLLQEAG